jgi:hypothetical protein
MNERDLLAALERACKYRMLDEDTFVCTACWQKAWEPNKPKDIIHKPDCPRLLFDAKAKAASA